MKTSLKRTASLALAALMAGGAFMLASCSTNTTNSNNTAAATTMLASSMPTGTTAYTANVPDEDYGGASFTVSFTDYHTSQGGVWDHRDIVAENMTGDSINDAVYQRNQDIDQKFNVNVTGIQNTATTDTLVKKTVASGDGTYDLFMPVLNEYNTSAMKGYFVNLATVQYLDFSQPWWDSNCEANLKIADRLYGMEGDLTIMDKDATTALVFNKTLLQNLGLDSPYDMVRNGTWTLDSFGTMVKSFSKDVNGDGKMDSNDAYGYLYERDSVMGMYGACNQRIAQPNTSGGIDLTIGTQASMTTFTDIFNLIYDKDHCENVMIAYTDAMFPTSMVQQFADNRGLFMWIRMGDCYNLRAATTDFGILPQPKADANQTQYFSSVNPYVASTICIPTSVSDISRTAVILEALSAESKNLLQPAYYDVVLDTKTLRDDDSKQMLDIIYSNRIYDIGDIFTLGNMSDVIQETMTYKNDIASFIAKHQNAANTAITKLVNAYNSLPQ